MKYNHPFKVSEKASSYRIYTEGDNVVRLDFFNHILRVAMFKKDAYLFPTYSVCPGTLTMPRHGRDRLSTEGFDLIVPNIVEGDNNDVIACEDYKLTIEHQNFRMKLENKKGLLYQDREYISYNFENELGKGTYHYISREPEEKIFGLGDKTKGVNKTKQHFKLETFDAMGFDALNSDPLYKQIPFYICKNSYSSYGIYYDTYANGEIDFGSELNNYYGIYKYFHSDDEALIFYVIFGSVEEIVTRFSFMTGKNMFAPKWTLKYGGSTMSYTDAPDAEKKLREFIKLCKEYKIDCGQFYLSSGYTQIGEKRYVFNWNQDKIPDPKKLSDDFRNEGIEFLPNVKPAFLTDHFLYNQIAEKGWFLSYEDGSPAQFPFWSGMGSYLDFTNDEAYEFWTKCVKEKLVDLGYNSIWNDNNEYDIHDDDVYACGFGHRIKAKLIRPLFSMLMTMASHDAQSTEKRHMTVSRSGIAGQGRISQTWTGDNNTSFADFRGNHYMAMTMSLSGEYFFGADIGGFAGPRPEKELFLRWIQYGLFQPRFVLHSWNPDGSSTMPWLYPELKKTIMKLFAFRKEMLPYLYDTAYHCVDEYKPMIYPVFLKYENYDTESDAFFLGENILVHPIFDEGKMVVETELPHNNGGWYERGEHYVKGIVKTKAPLDKITPYYIKGGSVVPTDDDGLTFTIYPLESGSFDVDFFDDDGESLVTTPNLLHISVDCSKDLVMVKSDRPIKVKVVDHFRRKTAINTESGI